MRPTRRLIRRLRRTITGCLPMLRAARSGIRWATRMSGMTGALRYEDFNGIDANRKGCRIGNGESARSPARTSAGRGDAAHLDGVARSPADALGRIWRKRLVKRGLLGQ